MKFFSANVSRNWTPEMTHRQGLLKVYSEEIGISRAEESVHWIPSLLFSQGFGLPGVPSPGDPVQLIAETDKRGSIDWDHVWWMHPPMTHKEGEGCPEELAPYYPDVGWWSIGGTLIAVSTKTGEDFVVIKHRSGRGIFMAMGRTYLAEIPDLSGGRAAALATLTATCLNAACYVSSSSVLPARAVFIQT